MPIKEIMTTELVVLAPTDTMERVHDLFHSNSFHHLPVVNEEEKVVGMISKSDYLALSTAFPLFKPEKRDEVNLKLFRALLVEDVMTRQVATLEPDDPIAMAAGYFRENRFHAIPIVEKSGKLVGLLSTYDLLNYLFDQAPLLT